MTDTVFHREFMATLDALRHGAPAPAPAWRVYANTGLLACIDALRANYPAVSHLLGEPAFAQLAASYARACPAQDARLFLYGADFPHWLRQRDGAASPVALAATLDRYWTESHSEADAPPLATGWIAHQQPEALAALRLRPAPSTRWLALAGVPLWDWWQGWRHPHPPDRPAPLAPPSADAGQAVLLTRPDDAVLARPMPLACAVLLQACEDGMTLPQALQAAQGGATQAVPQTWLATLFAAGAFQHPHQWTPRCLP